ncbi:hypothetical protein PPL_00666 [Heterostelium album PN500]|uniref:Uncharacterized protein n=1 Tax=Heterostelium pallidum (strain ATCC 26659 / Pp 5 / PN500) TaxID=670386 RepID=D3AX37_HETP5|nr:hypothetical protein PPL_00666 [Heterostelium album PN500]EFA86106.1 hypothetical protein PPL_00666 [Heterostelium album PN500]|eukprot:XP_020438212.1 hypothetical protein PPL_00666 [Heterostelium album PN500]
MNIKIVLFVFLLSVVISISMASSTAGSSRWATTTGEPAAPPTTGQPATTTGDECHECEPTPVECHECDPLPRECVFDHNDPDALIKLNLCLRARIRGPVNLDAHAEAHARVTAH